jgi:hypothetical protein
MAWYTPSQLGVHGLGRLRCKVEERRIELSQIFIDKEAAFHVEL